MIARSARAACRRSVDAVRGLCRSLLAGLALAGVVPGLAAQGPGGAGDEALIAALRRFAPEVIRFTGAPGLNLALARRGQVIWAEGFGVADLERETPMTPATVTHSGSMGKTYTAVAVMQLVERGILELDAPVNRYLKGFQITNPLGGRAVTVRDFLTHRSGLASNAAYSVFGRPPPLAEHVPAAYGRTRFKPYGGAAPMWNAKPGERYTYSNLGIATLGYLVEVTNPERLSFSDYVQRHIIEPLGMRSTQYPPVQDSVHVRPDIWARMSSGYSGFGAFRVPTPPIYFGDFPAGTVVTTPGDHIRLLLALMEDGRLDGREVLKPETVRTMLTPQHELAEGVAVGLVWNLRDWDGPLASFGHSGAHMWGWTNTYIAFPKLDVALAVSMNQWSVPDDPSARYREATLIIDFVKSWVQREQAGTHTPVPERSWAWKVSYVAGLMIVNLTNGALGIEEPIDGVMLDAMVRGARGAPARAMPRFDPEGFRAGVADLSRVPMTIDSIRAFLGSARLQVLPEELPLAFLELGGRGSLPIP